ncbi:MAG: RNA polymerase sigma factor [Pseudomonadota bacterium]
MAGLDLEALFRGTYHDLLRFLRARLGARHTAAQDLAQEAFMRMHAADAGSEIRDTRSFLFATAANLVADHARVEGRRRDILREMAGVLDTDHHEITPERAALARSDLAWVRDVLRSMPARQRHILIRYHIGGRTQSEIAAELSIGLTTVRADLKTAIGTLVDARRRVYRREIRASEGARSSK